MVNGEKRGGGGVTVFNRHADNLNRDKHLQNYLLMEEVYMGTIPHNSAIPFSPLPLRAH